MEQRTDRVSWRTFLGLALPLLLPLSLRSVLNSAVAIADVLMLGRLGDTALSAASLGGQVRLILTMVFSGLVSGASILIAQYWGRGDRGTVERVLAIALRFSLLIAVPALLVSLLTPGTVLRLYTDDPLLAAAGAEYLRYVSPAFPIMAVTDIYWGAVGAVGRVKASTAGRLLALGVNVALNAVLIFGKLGFPALGVRGAAAATVCARLTELLVMTVYCRRRRDIRIRPELILSRQGGLFRDFLRYAVPTTLNDLVWVTGYSMTGAILGRLGADAVAASSAASQVREIMLSCSYGAAGASAVLVGAALGSGRLRLGEEYGRKMLALSALIGGAAGLLVLSARPVLPGLLHLSAQAEGYTRYLLTVMAFFAVLQAVTTEINLGVFRAGGDPRFALILDFLAMWGVNVGLGALSAFVFRWPARVTLVLILSDEVVKLPILLWRYGKKIWVRDITRPNPVLTDNTV